MWYKQLRSLRLIGIICVIITQASFSGFAQDNVSLVIKSPAKTPAVVSAKKQFITGLTCKTCSVSINGVPLKVYSTGAFAAQVAIDSDTAFEIVASGGTRQLSKEIAFILKPSTVDSSVAIPSIEKIETFPAGDLLLKAGDIIRFRVKAFPGSTVSIFNNHPLYELPVSATKNIAGIYQGEYQVKGTDNFSALRIPVILIIDSGRRIIKETSNRFSVMSPFASDVALTKGRLAHLEYGLGDDRLGGAKIGYLDSLIPLKIIGKVDKDYKIQLTKNRTAYIEEDLVTLMPKGSVVTGSLTSNWQVYGDGKFDYVEIGLQSRLPYQSAQTTGPAGITVDIFGAVSNTNWITRLESAKEISDVSYEQISDEQLRIFIKLNHQQHWGHHIFYKGNNLVIRIKQQPASLALKDLTIAVDAGHGGSNTGAQGLTGIIEKDITLSIALELQKQLQQQGAKVIMTRTAERFFDNKERILFYRDSLPDLLVSIHMNSSADPVNVEGTMMFYRYPGFRTLNEAIYRRMLELGLKAGGITSSFNFMLNSPTEYPNALVETLFLSNLGEEEKITDPVFRSQVAGKILNGIKDFLEGVSGK